MVFRFHKRYYLWAVLLFITEALIAMHMHDNIIRPFGGDVLVVILLYCMVRCVANVPVKVAAIGVMLFAFMVETLQYFHIVEVLGWGNSPVARVIIGNTFEWTDLLAYILGTIIVLLIERLHKSFPA